MNILVTGGAGFIGSHFIRYILDKYDTYRVVCVDSLTYAGNINNLKNELTNNRFKFINCDITDYSLINTVFSTEKIDVVVNFAAESHVDKSICDPKVFLTTNVIGTQALMDASIKHGVSRFHQVSTDEVYGDLYKHEPKFTEDCILKPSSPYAASKASADLLAMAYFRTFGLNVTISRSTNNYGECQFIEKLIPMTIFKAMKNEYIPVYGTGNNIRDWIYVIDHCIAIDVILHKGTPGNVYNVGSNNEKTNLEIIHEILNITGKSTSLISYVPDRAGHDFRYALDTTKINKELGWKPKYEFNEQILNTVLWYTRNIDWFNGVR